MTVSPDRPHGDLPGAAGDAAPSAAPSAAAGTPPGARPIARPDLAVIGGGAAGLHVALEGADAGASVVVISRKPLAESASFRAQGGLAAAIAADDSAARHAEDTFNAGRQACRTEAVEALTNETAASVENLMSRGVEFDREPDGSLALSLEGGHTARRIVHAGGAETGRAITSRLAELVGAHPLIELIDDASATALWVDAGRCVGVVTDCGNVIARATVLATGGGAALWKRTTNPWGAIGAGAVLAHAAGADLADLELCQFHPTALALPGSRFDGTLITEAVRGEGALLLAADGRRFTDELAPRDQVSTAILDRMDADGSPHVRLDLRPIPLERFPSIERTVREAGLDPAEPVPVAPASHYLIGGIKTDLEGRSSLPGLYAVGESGCTGLHGANRLASNSLSECFVFGTRAARAAQLEPDPPAEPAAPRKWRFTAPTEATRVAVWEHAGPRRSAESLASLADDPYPLARLIGISALARTESRGVQRRLDHPLLDPGLDRCHVIVAADGTTSIERWA